MTKTVWFEEVTTPEMVAVCPFCEERMEGCRMSIMIHAHGGMIFAHSDCADKAVAAVMSVSGGEEKEEKTSG